MSHCPSCGQFVGPRDACPHCGAHLDGRMVLRTIKIAAVTVTAVGLLLLWLLASRAQVPTVPIGQVGATMNLAYVRLAGRVIRSPSFDPASSSLAFWLADDTGEIYVAAYRHTAQDLVTANRVPALGDRVSVAGTLRIRKDFASVTIDAAGQLKVTTPPSLDRQVAEIGPYSELERVRLCGQVRGIRAPYQALTLIGLRDASGAIEIAVPEETLTLTGALPPLAPGQWVEVTGTVSFYKETPQLTLTSVADVTPLTESANLIPIQPMSQIGLETTGDWVGVQGFVTGMAYFSAGVKLALDDGSGQITVLLWQDLYDELMAVTALQEGVAVTVYGQVSEYRGQTELIPELPVDVQLVAAPPPPERFAIGELTARDVGRHVQLAGTLSEPDPFSAGCKFTLDDGTGQIALLLWQRTYEEVIASQTLQAGTDVVVTGKVAEYRGALEIIPRRAADVTVTGYTPPLIPRPSPISHITVHDADQIVTLTGTLKEPQSFSAGQKFILDDGSGEIILLLWQDVYATLDGALTAGVQVQVRGRIAEYRGDLEIIPRAADDVMVLSHPTPVANPTRAPTATPTPTPAPTIQVVYTPPPCKKDEGVYFPDDCPGGCGTQCATLTPAIFPTPTPAPVDTSVTSPSATPRTGTVEPSAPTPVIAATPMSELDAGCAGETFAVRGHVADTASLAGGFKFTLDDGTGQIVLLLWDDVYDAVAGIAGLNTGATVHVTGEIGEYQAELQIVPAKASDVTVEITSRAPDIPRHEIGELSTADVGALVEIEGMVSRVEGFDRGLRIYLADGSGEVQLLLWQNVADRVPQGEKLVVGARVRAVGEVDEYKGMLQVVPHLPLDVTMLAQ